MKLARPVLPLVVFAIVACNDTAAPLDQWLLRIGTDAPLPDLGDRLRIEVLDAEGHACNGCRRDFGAGDPSAFPLSIGITRDARFDRVRARLYLADHLLSNGEPDPTTSIDLLARLPGLPTAVETLSLSLTMSCISVPADVASSTSCDPTTGSAAPLVSLADHPLPSPGSWVPGKTRPCAGDVPTDMVCVEGGAFFMGDNALPGYGFGFLSGLDLAPEHLVQLSAYAMDRDEMTVGAFRSLTRANPSFTDRPSVHSSDSFADANACAFITDSAASNDALSLNCIKRATAAKVCALAGKVLPTEAQFEFAARNRNRRTRYPWGAEDAPCSFAIIARGRTLFELGGTNPEGETTCRSRADGSLGPWGPVAGGSPLDVTSAGIRNLGGNLGEWVQDDLFSYGSACWSSSKLLVDPVCTGGKYAGYRGGSHITGTPFAQGVLRNSVAAMDVATVGLGFRCVKPMP